jgi:hypothetical protein
MQSLLAVLLFLPVGLQAEANVQREKSKEPFVSIPVELQPKLRQRLKVFITFQSKRQWKKMYDLSIEPIQQTSLTKEEFIKSQVEGDLSPYLSTLLEFTPQGAVLINEYEINEYESVREWLIEGCAKYRREGKVVYLKAGLHAGLSNKQWYFSNLYTLLEAVDGPEIRCRMSRNQPRGTHP